MESPATTKSARIRLLGLGNEILADDAFGILAAREVERLLPRQIEVVCSSAAGFNLLDDLLGASRLVVVDTIVTGAASPGTIHVFSADQVSESRGIAPHFLGLFEVLALGRQLHLDVPEEAAIIAVEAEDCATVGGEINPDVRSAITGVLELVKRFIAEGTLAWQGLRHSG
jgi:hydrogenase maturation protease